MHRLVMLWQQVDRDLPYFVTAKFLEYAASGRQLEREARRKRAAALLAHQKTKKKKAAKAAEKASTKKKNKSGMRQPRLVASMHCMFLSCVCFFYVCTCGLNYIDLDDGEEIDGGAEEMYEGE